MTASRILTLSAALVLFLGACDTVSNVREQTGRASGLQTGGAGLTVPPGYGSRPQSGERTDERSDRTVIQRATPGDVRAGDDEDRIGTLSAGESAVLRRSGYEESRDPVVRRTLDIEASRTVEREREFVDKLLRWDPERSAEADAPIGRSGLSARPIIRRRGEF